jgi:hypothetical protein
MKFAHTVPARSSLLYVQIWDFDVLKYNDCLAETVLDLSDACKTYVAAVSLDLWRAACIFVFQWCAAVCRPMCHLCRCSVYRTNEPLRVFYDAKRAKKAESKREKESAKRKGGKGKGKEGKDTAAADGARRRGGAGDATVGGGGGDGAKGKPSVV